MAETPVFLCMTPRFPVSSSVPFCTPVHMARGRIQTAAAAADAFCCAMESARVTSLGIWCSAVSAGISSMSAELVITPPSPRTAESKLQDRAPLSCGDFREGRHGSASGARSRRSRHARIASSIGWRLHRGQYFQSTLSQSRSACLCECGHAFHCPAGLFPFPRCRSRLLAAVHAGAARSRPALLGSHRYRHRQGFRR